MISPVAGIYPIWLNVPGNGHILWQNLGPGSLPPFQGHYSKQIWAFADNIQGKLRISGRQLDGNGTLLFPNDASGVWMNDTSIKYSKKPLATLIIDTTLPDHQITSPKPKGYQLFGSNLIYSNPGCFQFTASINNNTVDIVVEILSK